MRFELYAIDGSVFEPELITSYELVSEVDSACDGLRLNFTSHELLGEICIVKAYSAEKLFFNGFCDMQRITSGNGFYSYFIYARSSAALLVDNEAVPCLYNCPSARQLWYSNARDMGFECELPEICSEYNYLVSKGTSCYGAINDFVFAVYGAPVYASPENVLCVYKESKDIKKLEDYSLLSLSCVINRSEPISDIDYKINSSDDYVYHFKSDFLHSKGFLRKRLFNLSAVPIWQREITAAAKIKESLSEYYSVIAEISGECDVKLCDRISVDFAAREYGGEFLVNEIVKSMGKSGEKTTLVLKKRIDGELVNYVA